MLRPCHPRPCLSSQGHGTAWPLREVLWAVRVRLLPAITRRSTKLLSEAYKSKMQVASVKPNTVYHRRGKEWLQHTTKKTICYTVGLAVGCFRLPCGHLRRTRHCRSRARARHSMCELTHGMTGERHAMCESAFIQSFLWLSTHPHTPTHTQTPRIFHGIRHALHWTW